MIPMDELTKEQEDYLLEEEHAEIEDAWVIQDRWDEIRREIADQEEERIKTGGKDAQD